MKFTKEMCYLLGYLWADGNIYQYSKPIKKDPDNIYYRITLEILESDGEIIKNVFEKSNLSWNINTRYRRNSRNKQMVFALSNFKTNKNSLDFLNLLINNGYLNKSDSHYQILDIIPENMHCYWMRGFFDGDGCISISKKTNSIASRLYFYGPYNQNWEFVTNKYEKLDIKYTYQTISRKNGKYLSSHIVVSNKTDINKFFNFIYNKNVYDFGLFRKYEKLLTNYNYNPKVNFFRRKRKSVDVNKIYS